MAQIESQDAIALLQSDHRRVEKLFTAFESAGADGQKELLAQQICLELTIHTQLEEEIFYPACDGIVEEEDLAEAFVEHDGAKVLIAEIEAGAAGDEFYDAKIKVLSEMIEHHVEEEEEAGEGIFAQARDGGLDLEGIGRRMVVRREELLRQYDLKGLPPPEATTLDQTTLARPSP